MGLDMRPMGKPKPGFEQRFTDIFLMVSNDTIPEPTFLQKMMGKKKPTKQELMDEWFANQLNSYETIKAPMVGRDPEAENWLREQHEKSESKLSFDEFLKENHGYYVIDLAKEKRWCPALYVIRARQECFQGAISC